MAAVANSRREPAPDPRAESPVPRLLTIAETAKVLGVSVMTVRKYIDRGELPKVKLDRSVRIDSEHLHAFIADHVDSDGRAPRVRRSPSKR